MEYEFSMRDDTKCLTISQQYSKVNEDQTFSKESGFWVLYKVKIHKMNLCEMLMINSLYLTKAMSGMLELIED